MAITSTSQPLLVADTFAEITPASYPNNSLFYVIDRQALYRINSSTLVFIGSFQLDNYFGKTFSIAIGSSNFMGIN